MTSSHPRTPSFMITSLVSVPRLWASPGMVSQDPVRLLFQSPDCGRLLGWSPRIQYVSCFSPQTVDVSWDGLPGFSTSPVSVPRLWASPGMVSQDPVRLLFQSPDCGRLLGWSPRIQYVSCFSPQTVGVSWDGLPGFSTSPVSVPRLWASPGMVSQDSVHLLFQSPDCGRLLGWSPRIQYVSCFSPQTVDVSWDGLPGSSTSPVSVPRLWASPGMVSQDPVRLLFQSPDCGRLLGWSPRIQYVSCFSPQTVGVSWDGLPGSSTSPVSVPRLWASPGMVSQDPVRLLFQSPDCGRLLGWSPRIQYVSCFSPQTVGVSWDGLPGSSTSPVSAPRLWTSPGMVSQDSVRLLFQSPDCGRLLGWSPRIQYVSCFSPPDCGRLLGWSPRIQYVSCFSPQTVGVSWDGLPGSSTSPVSVPRLWASPGMVSQDPVRLLFQSPDCGRLLGWSPRIQYVSCFSPQTVGVSWEGLPGFSTSPVSVPRLWASPGKVSQDPVHLLFQSPDCGRLLGRSPRIQYVSCFSPQTVGVSWDGLPGSSTSPVSVPRLWASPGMVSQDPVRLLFQSPDCGRLMGWSPRIQYVSCFSPQTVDVSWDGLPGSSTSPVSVPRLWGLLGWSPRIQYVSCFSPQTVGVSWDGLPGSSASPVSVPRLWTSPGMVSHDPVRLLFQSPDCGRLLGWSPMIQYVSCFSP